ncbi:M23 family metallopeptidase [Muricauda oceani]|uniref:M23 family metallopeptidase n=1 Tax=Flagellimonas oceani TaxID=2698672 RepID=A0A6G7J4L7_9FLAO|nr:M23 family metallopeptidase [Allomuricauda oceani]MBW8242715.1 M23 family metallopeptidase [Allomuricauda oceani]QII45548.1 M23 family metallopeptidase [Allomuricauda oceani]
MDIFILMLKKRKEITFEVCPLQKWLVTLTRPWTIILTILAFTSCREVQHITDIFVQPTDREKYVRTFEKNDPRILAWNKATQSALSDTLSIALPYAEVGILPSEFSFAYGYDVQLQNGRKLKVSVTSASDSLDVFVDIYQFPYNLAKKPLLSQRIKGSNTVELHVKETGDYKVLIQPKIGLSSDFRWELYSEPTLIFPVLDVDSKAIQSFWGDTRAGGARRHEGVDIFAPRSTPVVAVTEGRVSSVGNKGLGGKQVWFRDGLFNNSFYYAHLDSINVSFAQKVEQGDTLGFVGNTGNARTTVPHLHFGIYSGKGAIDPLPFIKKDQQSKLDLNTPLPRGHIGAALANVRVGPSVEKEKTMSLEKMHPVIILGKTINWYHVLLNHNIQGYVHHSLVVEG